MIMHSENLKLIEMNMWNVYQQSISRIIMFTKSVLIPEMLTECIMYIAEVCRLATHSAKHARIRLITWNKKKKCAYSHLLCTNGVLHAATHTLHQGNLSFQSGIWIMAHIYSFYLLDEYFGWNSNRDLGSV
jgi:hypothetical protein